MKKNPRKWIEIPEGIYPISFTGIYYNKSNRERIEVKRKIKIPDDREWKESPMFLNAFFKNYNIGVWIGDIPSIEIGINASVYIKELVLSNGLVWKKQIGWIYIEFKDFIEKDEMMI